MTSPRGSGNDGARGPAAAPRYLEAVDQIVVRPGPPLAGSVQVGGAKNSALKLMAATLLAEGDYRLRNIPEITDVDTMAERLDCMGLDVRPPGPPEVPV